MRKPTYHHDAPGRLLLWLAVFLVCVIPVGAVAGQTPPGESAPTTKPADPPDEKERTDPSFVIVEGQVFNEIGGGQAEVAVTVHWAELDGEKGKLIASATTDELGDFKVTVAQPIRGDVVVTLSKPRYAEVVRKIHVGDSDWPEFLAEQLPGNLAITGRVIDALTEKPVPAAKVTLEASYSDLTGQTDEKGAFTIKGVSPGRGHLIVEATGYGREKRPLQQLEDQEEILVPLKPERIVHLKIVDQEGRPIERVTVECLDELHDDFRTVVTGKNGTITLRGIHFDASLLGIRLTHEAYVSSQLFDREIATPEQKTESSHELAMEPAGRIAGTVTSLSGGPLQGARVMTGSDGSDLSPRDWANYQGHYAVQGVKPGSVTVTVHLSGYAPKLQTVDVRASETLQLDIQLRKGAILKGSVKTKDGQPVRGAFVDAGRWRGAETLGLRAVTDGQGTFVIESAPSDEFELVVSAGRSRRTSAMVRAGGDKPIELVLPDAPEATGGGALIRLRVGDAAPDFSTTALTGQAVRLRDLAGKTLLLDFWATWCGPCVADLPHLVEVQKKFAGREDFVMIGVSLDFDEKILRKFLTKRKIDWQQVFGDDAQSIANQYGVEGIPAVFLVSPEGKIIAADLHGEQIVKVVEEALSPSDPK